MTDENIQELITIVKSCRLTFKKNTFNRKYIDSYNYDEVINKRCEDFCNLHNINITHGSAYKELSHKMYYYLDKYVQSFLTSRIDLYKLRTNHILSDTEIVDLVLKKVNKNVINSYKKGRSK